MQDPILDDPVWGNPPNFSGPPAIDCTEIIEQVKQAATDSVNRSVAAQQSQINQLSNSVQSLLAAVNGLTNVVANGRQHGGPNVPDGTLPQQQQQNLGPNTLHQVQPTNNTERPNVLDRTQPLDNQMHDAMSVAASGRWFRPP